MRTKRFHIGKSGEVDVEFVAGEALEAYDALAREAIGECRASITMAARFLNAALWRLPLVRAPLARTISAGARELRYDPENVVERYRASQDELARDCLHAVLHCVFHHPFDTRYKERDTWSLACDIAVEACAIDLAGARFASERDGERAEMAKRLSKVARNLTAPGLYQVLRHGGPGEQLYVQHGITGEDIAYLRDLFVRDGHDLWANGYAEPPSTAAGSAAIPDMQAGGPGASEAAPDAGEPAGGAGSAEGDASTPAGGLGASEAAPDAGEPAGGEGSAEGDASTPTGGEGVEEGGSPDGADAVAHGAEGAAAAEADPPAADELPEAQPASTPFEDPEALEEWRKVSKQVEAEMRMQRRRGTAGEGAMVANLSVANRKPADYDSFLARFATLAEDIRVNDDEFDYVFYTFGLNRYGNMPLVEPLEYVESSRVREFVIALDTSGSCSGRLIREFVQRTYDILRQRTSFGDDINVHIVQCDKEVRTATKVTSLAQLEEYRDSFWVSGGGGTDFKPVFAYVDSLVEQGEFNDLRGLIYFTDGYGSFPVRAPDYDVAFVFVDVEGLDVRVPPWAMKVVMTQDEILET